MPTELGASTIAGYPFSVQGGGMTGGMTGGMLSLRFSLGSAPLVELARALAKLAGVRVTAGPAIVSRGDCYVVHCPGFKMVLSATAPGSDVAQALLSRALEPTLAIACELGQTFARLMKVPPPPRASADGPTPGSARPDRATRMPVPVPMPGRPDRADRPVWTGTSTLRRAALQPGKTLLRKTPLARKTPLGRGKGGKP